MDSKIGTQSQGLKIEIANSRARQTPKTDFGTVMETGLTRTANAVMEGGRLAAPFIPGGAVLSAAVNGMGSVKSTAIGAGSTNTMSSGLAVGGVNSHYVDTSSGGGSLGTTGGSGAVTTGGSADSVEALAASGDKNAMMMLRTQEMQEMNQSFNLEYLALQQNMQSENRQFTTLSNIMKTKHDTAKNAINNVR